MKHSKYLLFVVLLLALVLAACGKTPAPAPVATTAPTKAPVVVPPTETPVPPTATAIPPTPTPQTDFSVFDYSKCFAEGDSASGDGFKRSINGSKLDVTLSNQGIMSPCEEQEFSDFTFKVDVTLADPSTADAGYGIQFRSKRVGDQSFQFYEFGISQNKWAYFVRVDDMSTGKADDLMKAIDVSKMLSKIGEVNHLKIVAIGDIMLAYVNDTLVAQVQDATLPSGVVGFVASNHGSKEQHVVFENAMVSYIPESAVLLNDSEFASGNCFGDQKQDWYEASTKDGAYNMIVKPDQASIVYCENERVKNDLTDFILDADITVSAGKDAYPGLTFRANWDNYAAYSYMIGPSNAYSFLGFWPGQGNSAILAQQDGIKGMNKTGSNHLKVVAVGDLISVYVNGNLFKQVHDASAASGAIGFTVQNDSKTDDGTVAFDNVKLTSLVLP